MIKHLQDNAVFPAQEQEGGIGQGVRLSGSIALEEQAHRWNLTRSKDYALQVGSLQGNQSAVSRTLFADTILKKK